MIKQALCDVSSLLDTNSRTYYLFSNNQITIHPIDNSYANILNNVGADLCQHIISVLPTCPVISDYGVISRMSGVWIPSTTSPYYEPHHVIMLNTWDNYIICGTINGEDLVTTSTVVLYNTTFCLTISGSIYQLNHKLH